MERLDLPEQDPTARAKQAAADVSTMFILISAGRFSGGVTAGLGILCLWRDWIVAGWTVLAVGSIFSLSLMIRGYRIGQRGRKQLIKLKREGEAGRAGASPME